MASALIEHLARASACSKAEARRELDRVVDAVVAELAEAGSVDIRGLGKITLHRCPDRRLRSGITGEEKLVPGGTRATLKLALSLKRQLREGVR